MSLKPAVIHPVPEETARVARAAFRRGNPLLNLRDELGAIFADADFADLFPKLGQPGLAPWRLALVTLLQFREDLPDRRAAEAVRARIDWKYLLGLDLTDPGFDHSVLCEFRSRLLEGSAEERLLGKLLEACQARGLLKARGRRQRTDATHVLASIRTLNRLELLGETLRAALNELATVAPDWLRSAAPRAWYERYALRVEDGRLPRAAAEREAYARTVGEDGFALLDHLDRAETAAELRGLPKVLILRQVWARQFVREPAEPLADGGTCPARPLCTRAAHQARHLKLQPRAAHEALGAARERLGTKEGRRRYARRAGIEGPLSQGVRAFGLRRSRYRGLAKTHLQHVATAAAVNLERLAAWFRAVPRAATRTSRFAALAASADFANGIPW